MTDNLPPLPNWLSQPPFRDDVIAYARAAIDADRAARGAVPAGYTDNLIQELYEEGDPVSVDAAEELKRLQSLLTATQQVAQPTTDAQKLATAIAEAATKVGITDASIHSFSGPQLLMLLDDMVGMAQAKPEQAAQTTEIRWPKAKDVGRYCDMSPSAHMRVGLDNDNDAYVSIWDENGGGSVEFCNGGGGGGSSMKTRLALIALMVAMEEDNAARPDKDWWARRAAGSAPQKPKD